MTDIREKAIEAAAKTKWEATVRSAVSVHLVLPQWGELPAPEREKMIADMRTSIDAYEAAMWRPIEEMKRDSTFYLIEVEATDETHNPLEEEDVFVTIGCNGFDDDGVDEWKLSGWNWSHDCLMECSGVIPRRFRPLPTPPEKS